MKKTNVYVYGDTLHVVDYKHGKGVPVSADHNPQMMLYALGALTAYQMLYSIDTIKMSIVQPRLDSISEWEIKSEELLKWGDEFVKPRAEKAFKGEGDCVPGEHCRFCRAKAICRARAVTNLDLAKYAFAEPATLSNTEIGEILQQAQDLEKWVKDEHLGMIASHYDGFAQGKAGVLDSMLIPAFSMLIKQGTACAVEGDMKVAMAMSILKTIAGTGQLSEMYSIDFNEDICIIGHSGSGDADISQAKKPSMKIVDVFHGKTGGGYLTQFYPPVGDVTYLGITQDKDGHFKFVAAEGVNEDGPIFTFGDTNMRTRFSIGAREFCNRWSEAGPTHHMAAAVGHHIDTILKVAKILDVPVEVVCR